MRSVNLSALDLNLLVVFLAVLEEGTTVRAAARLSITQSAVSNALSRLRHALEDPLFVRHGRGITPTPRALALRPAVTEALHALERALGAGFDASTTTRTFTLAAADHHQAADLPKVARAFAQAMPRACLRIVSVDYLVSSNGLVSGSVDAALAPEGTQGQGLYAARLFRERAALLVRRGHPACRGPMTLTRLATLGHIDVHVTLGAPGRVNDDVRQSVAGVGFARRVSVIVPSFTTAAMIAAQTDDVAWLPEHAAELFARLLGLERLRAPLPPLEIGCDLVWHERTHADAGARALRELVLRTLREPGARRRSGQTKKVVTT